MMDISKTLKQCSKVKKSYEPYRNWVFLLALLICRRNERGNKTQNCLQEMAGHAINFIQYKVASEKPYFRYLALPAPHTTILPADEFRGKSGLNSYADFVRWRASYSMPDAMAG